MPYVFLVNGGNKCVKVDVTRDQVVLVNYHAPDLQEVDEKKAGQRRMPGRDGDEDDDDQEDIAGMDRDTMFNRASGRRHNKVRVDLLSLCRTGDPLLLLPPRPSHKLTAVMSFSFISAEDQCHAGHVDQYESFGGR